jgi:hypothetical protein
MKRKNRLGFCSEYFCSLVMYFQKLEKKWEHNEAVHQLFVDFKKAYDSVRREVDSYCICHPLETSKANQNVKMKHIAESG